MNVISDVKLVFLLYFLKEFLYILKYLWMKLYNIYELIENNQGWGMERVTENKTGYELSIMEAEWQLHGSSLWKPFAFACGVFHNEKKKKSMGILW